MESNRNLSSIISKIRDEGPPGNDDAPPAASVDAGTGGQPTPVPAGTGRRTTRGLLLGLVLLFLVFGLVLFAGTYTAYRDGGMLAGITGSVRSWFGTSSAAGDMTGAGPVVVDRTLVLELRQEQRDLVARLDQLSGTVIALSETVQRNQAGDDTAIAGLRQDLQADFEALESRVAALQGRLDGLADRSAAKGKPAAKTKSAARTVPATRAAPAGKVMPDAGSAPDSASAGKAPVKQAAVAAQAEAGAGSEAKAAGEEWVVNVASSSRETAMVELAEKLKAQGIPVERQTLTIEGDLMYRLRVPGFATSGEARRYAGQLEETHGLRGAWISRR